ncbi:MAG: hypothetical protein KC776_11075 [Myxococcales bacterium]|nr:hypothetical protein [Myxococcales bacterium]
MMVNPGEQWDYCRRSVFGSMPNCTELPALDVATGQSVATAPTTADMAAGDAGFAVVWQSLSGSHRAIRVRTFGPHLCD